MLTVGIKVFVGGGGEGGLRVEDEGFLFCFVFSFFKKKGKKWVHLIFFLMSWIPI